HRADPDLASRLLRSYPPLDARVAPERLMRIRLACNGASDEKLLDRLLEQHRRLIDALRGLPRVLTHNALSPANVFITSTDRPILLNWDALRFDVIGSDLKPKDLRRAYAPDKIEGEMSASVLGKSSLPEWSLPLVVYTAFIDGQIQQENYAEALTVVPRILDVLSRVSEEQLGEPRVSA
ncbi:MAG: hypothetical protein ACNS61_16100, partial [Candidatus Wenzhouxiangella sp. M2_3B_020]